MSTTYFSSLLGHHDDAGADAVGITCRRTGASNGVDVSDEVANDEAGVVVRHRIVAVALARVVEAAPLPCPAGDVKVAERDQRDGTRRSVDVRERAVGGDVRVQNSSIADR